MSYYLLTSNPVLTTYLIFFTRFTFTIYPTCISSPNLLCRYAQLIGDMETTRRIQSQLTDKMAILRTSLAIVVSNLITMIIMELVQVIYCLSNKSRNKAQLAGYEEVTNIYFIHNV